MPSSVLVSVIIPTYNRAGLVCHAIDSVLEQTYQDREVIVVDDGSTDDTQSVLRRYEGRITLLRQENAGPSVARNRGIEASRGEIIAFLDSDDSWLPAKLERQVDLLQKAGPEAPCCLCNCKYSDGSGTTFEVAGLHPGHAAGIWLNPAEVLATRPVIFTQAVAVRRRALERVGGFAAELPFFCEDYELALRLALEGPWAILQEPMVICRRAGEDSLGEQALRDMVRLRSDQLEVHKRFAALVAARPEHAGLRRQARWELRRARRELLAARLAGRGSALAGGAARVLQLAGRVGRALFRRSPFYPRLVVRALS